MEKRAGIVLPLYAVPGNQGIGDLGQKTLMMIDELSKAGFSVWSMLPLTAMQDEHNPASAASAYAGDPVYINIDRLAEMGLLTQSSIINCNKFKSFVDYDTVREFKEFYFQRAFKAFRKNYARYKVDFERFKTEAFWLNNWTVYEVFRQEHEKKGWRQWKDDYRIWPEKQVINLRDYVEKVFYVQFLQYIFYKQLDEVTAHAREKGLHLMQDVPFFLNTDSAEVWSRKREFMISQDGTIQVGAGSPPSTENPAGEVYDTPMYNFDVLKTMEWKPFRNRIFWAARNFDVLRITQFKGMDSVWKLSDLRRPEQGKWASGPGSALMKLLREDNPDVQFIADDMGTAKPSLKELEKEFEIPGIDVLSTRLETKLLKKPGQMSVVVYTSQGNEPPLEDAYHEFSNNKKIALRRFFKKRGYDHRPFHDLVCHYALDSNADLVLLSMADIIGLKSDQTEELGNDPLTWKLKDFKTFPSELEKVKEWMKDSGRLAGE